ncbi:MAG TPA: hypothetical protein VGM37_07900 [Armatimonadota bacterium]|jgi:hypothetical protein
MSRVIDYWRGLIADIREADSNSPADLRVVGDLWYPALRMRVLAAVHDGAERKLGPCDVPAAHAEQVAHRVWDDLVAALHKRAVPEAWAEYAAVIACVRPLLAQRLGVAEDLVRGTVANMSGADVDDLAEFAFGAAYGQPLSSRDEHAVKGAINAFLLQDREWPDLGTWVPFTLYSLTARYFEQGHYLGPKLCSSESEILDLVEAAPYGRKWACEVVRRRAQTRTVESYLTVLNAILDRAPLPSDASLVSRRLTLVEWLSDPEARLTRMVEAQGMRASEGVIRRAFAPAEHRLLSEVLLAALGHGSYPAELAEAQRRTTLERLVEAMEAMALRTELIVHVAERNGKRGSAWAKAVVAARAPKAQKMHQLALLTAIATRKDCRSLYGPVQRNRTLRSLHRTLAIAARPDAGLQTALCEA